ncbi:MAG TPA: hypothetical protein VG055_12650 [Planctomycetaceae bacterium]|jgi:hypothetical protein|nr:hypothetical protein [Planctomycetaceae bacterium]
MTVGGTVICVEALMLALPLLLGVTTAAYCEFLAVHSEIYGDFTFEQFKSMARRDMYFTWLGILCYVGIGLCTIALFVYYGWLACLNALIVGLLIKAIGKSAERCKRLVDDLRSLPVEDQLTAAQFAAVIETWRHKPFPDF